MGPMKILLLLLIATVSNCQRFDFPSSPSRSPGLQIDRDGQVYTSAGSQLYRLNSTLQLKESRNLSSEAVNISLSSDGRWLVVCLTDLSCEVYNATNFSAGHVFRQQNAIRSTENIALFAAEGSFYVGSIAAQGSGASQSQQSIDLGQYRFGGSQVSSASRSYMITKSRFERNLYDSGFVQGSNAYYFASDNGGFGNHRSMKVMRVCHNSDFNALYELALICGGRTLSSNSRISGVSVLDNFPGMLGPIIVISTNRPLPSSQNVVCLYNLDEIDHRMQERFDSCAAVTSGSDLIELSWRNDVFFCSMFSPTDACQFGSSPFALDNVGNLTFLLSANVGIDLSQPNRNFITASAAVVFQSLLFVYVAYTDTNGVSYVSGFAIKNTTTTSALTEDQGFDRRIVSDGSVSQLRFQKELGMVYAVTDTSVIQFSIANCSSHVDCSSCLGNGNPLCGWCVVENKCSRINECRNSEDSSRWIEAARTNTDQCPTIMVSPEQCVMDNPQTINLTLSRELPMLQENEAYFCHFAGVEATFMVEAVGSGATYMCNITGSITTQYEGLATELNVSLVSSLRGIPFSTNFGGLTIYRCSETSSCSQCLQTNNACGWCVYNKVCSGTPTPCVNGTENFLQLSMNQDYSAVCPLLDRPLMTGRANYLQPVQANKNIELVTRNLPAEISGFNYMCSVNGIRLPTIYNNWSSLTCLVNTGDLTLPFGTGLREVNLTIRWVGQNSKGRNIDHTIDTLIPTNVLLYNCPAMTSVCSSCLGVSMTSGFECGWCDRPSGMRDTCSFLGDCPAMPGQTLATIGSQCPTPTIANLNPRSGPPEGGTTITITGTDLGVSFSDFTGNSIQVGGVTCTPTNPENYSPGQAISCTTTSSGRSTGSRIVSVTLPNGNAYSVIRFSVVSPQITRVFPSRGPQAGGTQLTVYGSDLNIGNIEDTRITLVGGTECTVNRASIQATNITCTTVEFTVSAPPMSGAVMVMIDSARVSSKDVQYMYTSNPEFYNVIPSQTILGGGIELIFNGTNLDVVQNPMLVVNDPQYLNLSNSTLCDVINSTVIRCVTPPLNRMQPGDTDGITYTIRVDNAPGPDPLANASLRIRVLPNPGNFQLIDMEYNTGSNKLIRIMGENLGSVTADNFNVTVGGQVCGAISVLETQINCEPPSEPPGGKFEATIVVSIGQYVSEALPTPLRYTTPTAS